MRIQLPRLLLLLSVPVAQATAQGRPSTDIWVAPLTGAGIPHVGRATNLTHRTGYDNQPTFTPDGKAILYTRIEGNGPSDIWRVDLAGTASRVTTTDIESEYSATPMPDGTHFSTIRVEADSTQRLWQFPMRGDESPRVMFEKLKPVGYHVWATDVWLGMYVLGNPNALVMGDARTQVVDTIGHNIGRALQKIPGRTAISYQQLGGDGPTIMAYDYVTKAVTTIAKCPPGGDYHIWLPSGTLVSASGSRLLVWVGGKWDVMADLTVDGVHNISRLALSPDGTRLAFVADDRTP